MKKIPRNAIKIFFYIYLYIKQYLQEDIVYQEKPNSIVPFRNNEQAIGSYEFHLRISQSISYKPMFLIQFPSIYNQILQNPENCKVKVQFLIKAEEAIFDCIQLETKWEYIDVGYLIIEIYDIINPLNVLQISSGEFFIESWSGSDFKIDQNKGFGTLAFPPQYNEFNSINIQNDGSQTAGFITNFLITFQPSQDYVPLTWFRLKFPDNFNYDKQLNCILVNTQQKLDCYIEKQHVFIKGLNTNIKQTDITQIKIVGIQNPYQAVQQTDDILFESLQPYLNTVIDYKDDIPGFQIKAGQVSEVYIEGFPLVQNLYVDYTIKFTPQNDIPSTGSVKITFPPTFQNLNNICRVTTGLESQTNEQISCTSDGLDIYIKNFKDFQQSEITVKIQATNPPLGGPTDQFIIKTFNDQQQENLIDIEENAGKPDFTGFDFYQPHFNCTYLELCTLDFRYFPDPTRTLPKSSNTDYSTIDFQIPHWWWINGTNDQPECLFEKDSAYQCWQREHIFSIQTPEDKDLGSCDYPISINQSQLTPIPGEYPFRILTYHNGGKWNSELPMVNNIQEFQQPIEQDTYVMTIPHESVYLLQTFSSSSNSNDESNLIHVRSTLFPFDLSAEGSINLNFTHHEDNYRDEAAWSFKLGTTVNDDALKEHPCRVYLNDQAVGYNNGDQYYNSKVRCYINSSNSIDKKNTFIQIFGFDRNLNKNEKFEFFIPRVKFCETENRLCKVTVSYTNTFETRDEPYVLNQREQDLHRVQSQVNLSSTISGSVTRSNNEKCQLIDLTIKVDNIPQDIQVGDYIIFKRVYSDWHFIKHQNYEVLSPTNNIETAHSILDHEFNIEYMVIKVANTIQAGNDIKFVIQDIINTPYAFSKAKIWGTFYSNNIKILDGEFPLSIDSTDGGIQITSLKPEDYWGNREGKLAKDYWHPFLLKFKNCMQIPEGGEILYTFDQPLDNFFADYDRNCTVWLNIKNKMANETHPYCEYDSNINGFRVREFEKIDKLQELAIQIRGKLDQDIPEFEYEIKTYNVTADTNTLVDFTSATYQSGPYTIDSVLAPQFEFVDWMNFIRGVYKDEYGVFEVIIETGHDMIYDTDEGDYFEFIFDESVNTDNIDCRYGEYPNGIMYPSVECTTPSAGQIKMILHFRQPIEANKLYKFVISTRRQQKQQGLTFEEVGIYTLSVYSYVGGVKQRTGKARYEVWGPKIDHFFIHSTNKVKNDWTLLTLHSEFQTAVTINKSDPVNDLSYAMLVVFFETANNGFLMDLGTGLPEFDEFPCDVRGLRNLNDRKNVECRLYYGYNDAPTKVEITKFERTTSVKDLLIRTPFIKNPDKEGVPNVWFEIQQHTISNNNLNIEIVHEGHYRHLNYTYTKHPDYDYTPLEEDDQTVIKSSQKKLNRTSTIQVPVITPVDLNENDTVAYKFPKYWPLVEQLETKDCFGIALKDCYTIVNQKHQYYLLVGKLDGNVSNGEYFKSRQISPNAEVPLMVGAPENIIESYVFHHTRLIKKYNLKNFNDVKGTADEIKNAKVDCDIKNPIEQSQWDYTVTFSLPHNMIENSQLQIIAHDYIESIPFCSQTSNSKLIGQIDCSISTNYAVITNFEPIDKNNLIEIKVNFQNPNYDSNNIIRDWTINSFFLESNGFYYLRGTTTIQHETDKCDIVPLGSQNNANQDIIWDHMYHQTNSTRIDDIGPLNFYLKFPTDITIDNTRYVIVELSKDFEQVPGEFVAIWNNTQFSSHWEENDIGNEIAYKIYLPKSGDFLKDDVHKLTLTTLNAQNNLNGFKYPSIPNLYQNNFEYYENGNQVLQQTIDINVRALKFTNFEAKILQSNPTHKNIIWIAFESDIKIQANQVLELEIPLQTKSHPFYKKLFDNDAGTGLQDNDQISCYLKEPNLAIQLTCTIEQGSQMINKNFKIIISNITIDIPSNQKVIILIDGITNPKYSSDLSHVNISLNYINNNQSLRFDQTYLFTISKKFSTIFDNLTEPSMSSYQIGNTNIQAEFTFKCSEQIKVYNSNTGEGYGDYLMMEFPEGYEISHSNLTQVKISTNGSSYQVVDVGENNNIIVWHPDVNLNPGQNYNFSIRKFNQALYVPNDSSFKINCIKNYHIVTENIYDQITQFQPLALDQNLIQIKALDSNDGLIIRDCYQKFQLEIQLDSTIDKIEENGKIEIYIPNVLQNYELYCENADDSDLIPKKNLAIKCWYNSTDNYYEIGNFKEIQSSKFIRINFWAKSPSLDQQMTLTVKIFKDVNKIFKLAEFQKDMPSINENQSCFSQFQFEQYNNNSQLSNIVINQSQQFEFYIQIPSDITITNSFEIQFPSTASIPNHTSLICFFDTYEGLCEIIDQSPLKIQIKTPLNLTLIALQNYLIRLEFRCGEDVNPGIKFTQSGTQQLTIDFGTYQQNKFFNVSPQLLNSAKIQFLFTNHSEENYFIFSIKSNDNLTAGSFIKIQFPIFYLSNKTQNFEIPNLELNKDLNKYCISSNKAILKPISGNDVICQVSIDQNFITILIKDFQTISAGSSIDFTIGPIKLHSSSHNNNSIDIKIIILDSSLNIISEEIVREVLGITYNTPTFTNKNLSIQKSKTGLGETAVEYTIQNINIDQDIDQYDYISFVFDDNFYFQNSLQNCNTSLSGSYKGYGRLIIFTPSNQINQGAYNFCIGGITNPSSNSIQPVKVYVTYSHYITRILQYNFDAFIQPMLIINNFISQNNNANQYNTITFDIDPLEDMLIGQYFIIEFNQSEQFVECFVNNINKFQITHEVNSMNIVTIEVIDDYSYSVDGVLNIILNVKNGIPNTINYIIKTSLDQDLNNTQSITIVSSSVVFDCFVEQLSFGTTSNIIISTTSSDTNIDVYLKNTQFTNPQNCLDDQLNTLTCTTNSPDIVINTVPSPIQFSLDLDLQNTKGFQFQQIEINGQQCSGIPLLYSSNTFQNFEFKTLHKFNSSQGSIMTTYWEFSGELDVNFVTGDVFMVDIIVLNDQNFNLGNLNDQISCALLINSTLQQSTYCKLIQSEYSSSKILITVEDNFNTNDTFKLILYNMLNAEQTNAHMNVYLKHLDGISSLNLKEVSFKSFKTLTNSATTSIESILSPQAQSQQDLNISLDPSVTQNDHMIYIITASKNCNKKISDFNLTKLNGGSGSLNHELSSCLIKTDNIVSNSIAIGGFEYSNESNQDNLVHILVTQKIDDLVVYIIEINYTEILSNTITESITLDNTTNQDLYVYDISLQFNTNGLYKSMIQIQVPSAFLTLSNCQVQFTNDTIITGTIQTSCQSNIISLNNIEYIDKGTLQFKLKFKSILNTNLSFSNGQINLIHQQGQQIISKKTNVIYDDPSSITNTLPNVQFWMDSIQYNQPSVKSERGQLIFKLQPQENILSTDVLYLITPSGFQDYSDQKLFCQIKNELDNITSYSQLCYYNNVETKFVIKMPLNQFLEQDKIYTFKIYSFFDKLRSILLPSIADTYMFQLEHRDSSDTLKNYSKSDFKIGESKIQNFCQKPYHVTPNERSSQIIFIKPQQNLSSSHIINIYFSIQNIKNQTIQNSMNPLNDSLKNSGQQIECQNFQYDYNGTITEIINFGSCQLYLGSNQNKKYLRVQINISITLNSNTLYAIYINNLMNPQVINLNVNSYVDITDGTNIIEFGSYNILYESQKLSNLNTDLTDNLSQNLTTTEIQSTLTESFNNPNYSSILTQHIDSFYIKINTQIFSNTIKLDTNNFLSVQDSQQILYGVLTQDLNTSNKSFDIIDIYSMKESQILNYTLEIYFIKNRLKSYQIIYTGQFESTSIQTQNLNLNLDGFQYNKNSYINFSFDNSKQIFEDSQIEISLQNIDEYFDDIIEETSLLGSNTIQSQTTSQIQTIKNLNFVDITNTITFKLGIITNQNTNQKICVKIYNQTTLNIIIDETCISLIANSLHFPFLFFTSEKRPIKVQSSERAGITLNFLMIEDLIAHQDKLIIQTDGDFACEKSKEFLCTLNYYIVEHCQYISNLNQWELLAPRESTILKDTYVTLKIIPIRQDLFHQDDHYILFPEYPNIVNLKLSIKKQSGNTTEYSIKNQYQVLPPRWEQNYLNTYIVQNDTLSNYKLSFILSRPLTDGRIIIELPTQYQYGRVYNDNFGTSYYHGQEFPCLINTTSQITGKCYIFFGNGILPGSIIIYPEGTAIKSQKIDITFPLLLNPQDNMTEVFIYVKGQTYNNTLLKWEDQIHYEDYLFVAKEISVTAENRPSPTWSPNNRVGEASTWSFSFVSNNELLTEAQGGFDKIIIFSEREELILINNNDDKILQCPGYDIVIYNQKNLIELAPQNQISIGDTVTLNFSNFFNQQYVITNGIPLYIDIWSGGYIAKRYRLAENIVQPNLLDKKEVDYKNNELETSAFDTYSYTILPKNKIPLGGFAIITMPDDFTNFSNCEIYGGVKAACIVQQNGNEMQIKLDLKESYDPQQHGDIMFKIDIKNPINPGDYTMDFISYYNTNEIQSNTDYAKIDEETLVTYTYDGVLPFVQFIKEPFTVWRRKTCPDNTDIGVFRFKIRFSETLTYDDKNHILVSNLQLIENDQDTDHHELLCYFDLDEQFHSVKSELCEYVDGKYRILIPEEVDFSTTNDYIISIESRNRQRGLLGEPQPPRNYVIIETNRDSIKNEIGIIDMSIRGCYFNNLEVNVVNWNEDFDTTIEINGSMESMLHLSQDDNRYRFQVLFQTYNEMKNTQYIDLGYTNLVNRNDTSTQPCYLHTDQQGNQIQNIYRPQDPYCEFYKGHEHKEESPLVFTLNSGYESQMNPNFRFGFGPFKNYQVTNMDCLNGCLHTTDGNRNTFTDITVQAQYQLENGLWVAMEERTHYRAIGSIYDPVDINSVTTNESVSIDDLELSRWDSRFNLQITLDDFNSYDTVYYDLPYPYDVKQRYDTSANRECSDTCNFYGKDTRRYVFMVNRSFRTTNIWHYGYSESPGFRNDLEFTTYFVRSNDVVKIVKGRIKTQLPTPRIILEHKVSNNPVNALLKYRIGLFLDNTYSKTHKYIRFYLPDDFTEVQDCKIKFGFRVVDVTDINNNMKCRITANHQFRGQQTTLVEFYNIHHYSTYLQHHYERIFIFEVTMKNPSTPRWTKEIHTEWFDNYDVEDDIYDASQIQLETIDGCNTGRYWVGESVPLANYFRVFRNRKSFIERKQKINQWGELHLRIQPKNIIPQDQGVVEIQLPSDYDIADGGQKLCEVGHDYHKDLLGQFCEITNERLIRVRTNKDKGLDQRCSLVRITTEESLNNNNGFQAPSELSDQNFDLYLKNDTQVLEYTGSDFQPESYKFILNQNLFIWTSSNECDDYSVVKIKFDTQIRLYPGYDNDPKQTDTFLKQPITSLIIYFNTYDQYSIQIDGFPLNLGYQNQIIPCKAIKNIQPKQNEDLECILEIQNTRNYYKPLKVTIKNFEEIPIDTQDIELHLLDIIWTQDKDNLGWVEFEIIQTKGDGTIQYLYEKQRVDLYSQQSTGIVYVSETDQNLMPIFSNNLVGQEMTLQLFFETSNSLIEKDTIVVEFPSSFIFPDQDKLNAIIIYTVNANNYFKTSQHYLYQSINKMHFVIPEFFAIQGCSFSNKCQVELKIQGIRNAAYAFNTPYQIKLRVIRNLKTYFKTSYDNLQPPIPSPFNFLKVKIDSNSSGDINIQYDFEFIPSYNFPINSIIYIDLDETKYKHINESYPQVVCQTSFNDNVSSCKVLPNQIIIKLSQELIMNKDYIVTLLGVKNPTFQGYTGINDIKLSVQHSNGYLINSSYFNTLYYIEPKNKGTIYLNLNLSSYFNTIPSEYQFTLQNTFTLPKGGIIQIKMPQKWSQQIQGDIQIEQLTGQFQQDKLIYTEQVVYQPDQSIVVQIIIQFEWPSQTRLYIYFKEIQNPKFISITQSFQVQTVYDNVIIDKSDVDDQDAIVEYLKYEPKVQLLLANFYPKNEGEVATYKFILSSELTIHQYTDIELIFSKQFEKFVAEPTKSLECSSSIIKINDCQFGNYKVTIQILQTIYPNEEFDLQISGVLNINIEHTGFLSIATKVNNKLNQYTYALATYQTIIAPKRMQLVKIQSQNDQTLVSNDYEFCIYSIDQIIQGSVLMIEFPKQFKLKKNKYQCFISNDFDNDKLQYEYIDEDSKEVECQTYSHIRRIDIYGLKSVQFPSQNQDTIQINRQCYVIKNIKNSTQIGESFNFILKYYNPQTELVYLKTFGHLDYPSNKHYQDSGLKITIDEINPIKVGALSEEIELNLEKQVSHDIQLKPISEGFTFIPELIDFKFNDSKIQKFRIKPDSNTKPGNYTIQFEKIEHGSNSQFSEIQDIQFELTEALDSNKIQIGLNQNVFRTAVGSDSLPVKIKLSQPSSEDLKIYINSVQPYQPDKLNIDPQFLEFKSGEIEKELNFKTLEGVISGQLELSIDPLKEKYFSFQDKFINFEVMPEDNDIPIIYDTIIQDIKPNSVQLRTQMSESGKLFYLVTKKNTPQPTIEEIINSNKRDKQYQKLNEKFGNEYVEITEDTTSYIYNNVYYDIDNLEQDMDYTIYTVSQDLAGNYSNIKQFDFKTQQTNPPVQFQLKFNKVQTKEDILKALSVTSGYSQDKFEITSVPDLDYLNDIENGLELSGQSFTYSIKINTNYIQEEDLKPFDLIQQLSEDQETLYELLPNLDAQFDYLMSTKELYAQSQNFTYVPFLQEVSTDQAYFNVSIFETGNVYGIVQETNIPQPTSIQIQQGLNYMNSPLQEGHVSKTEIIINRDQYRIWPSQLLKFDSLYHSTEYIAYIISDIEFDGQSFLMKDHDIKKITFKTEREIFQIEESYQYVENYY